jgi:hypothetical protein
VRRFAGVAATCALLVVGCGGVAELDSGDVETVKSAKSAVAQTEATGSFTPEAEEQVTALIALCREKPLSTFDGRSIREILGDVAPRLKEADPDFSRRMKEIATSGCD